jgi:hypothetical protein
MIKLIKFDGEWIVSDIEEIEDTTFGDPDCMLKYPYQVEGKCLAPWPFYSDEREIIVRSSEITVVAEPNTFILSSYKDVIEKETA